MSPGDNDRANQQELMIGAEARNLCLGANVGGGRFDRVRRGVRLRFPDAEVDATSRNKPPHRNPARLGKTPRNVSSVPKDVRKLPFWGGLMAAADPGSRLDSMTMAVDD